MNEHEVSQVKSEVNVANTVNPSEASYHAALVIGTTFCTDHGTKCRKDACMQRYGTDTDTSDAYFDSKPTAEDLAGMVPDGWYRLERSVRKCGGQRAWTF